MTDKINKFLDDKGIKRGYGIMQEKTNEYIKISDLLFEFEALSQHDVSKRKFAVEWVRNVNYGIGSGTEYFDAETREEALKLFWNGKNKEAFDVNTIYVC